MNRVWIMGPMGCRRRQFITREVDEFGRPTWAIGRGLYRLVIVAPHGPWCRKCREETSPISYLRCSGCGTEAPANPRPEGWRITDGYWCPNCAWLA